MPLDFFSKSPIISETPASMQEVVADLRRSQSQEECLRKAYAVMIDKYHGNRIQTGLKLYEVLIRDVEKLWDKNGFLHCTNINYVLRTLLIKSGHFTEDELMLRWAFIWYVSPHQYLQVRVDHVWISIDVWGYEYGVPYGEYSHGFH